MRLIGKHPDPAPVASPAPDVKGIASPGLGPEVQLELARTLALIDARRLSRLEGDRFDPNASSASVRFGGVSPEVESVDEANSRFWDDLCGSHAAKELGVVDRGPESLARFDAWYWSFYPYLESRLRLESLRGARVLEVGLGYGTVAQRIASCGAEYFGLDVAAGPVGMVSHRLSQSGLAGTVVQGSVLAPPLEAGSFDAVIAIGSLHHTGDLAAAVRSCEMLLRPGGRLMLMVYYAYSYRQVVQNPIEVLRYARSEDGGYLGVMPSAGEDGRGAYDRDSGGHAAPTTDFISRASLRGLCRGFSRFSAALENINQEQPFPERTRDELLATSLPSEIGLDLYADMIR